MTDSFRKPLQLACACALGLTLTGCSIKMMAINTLGNALSEGSSGFATDDDPELVRDAVPFALKTIESLVTQAPKHRGLLTAACSGFTQYAYAFVQMEADYTEAQDLARATAMRARAKKLYLRAFEYGLRGIEVDLPGFRGLMRKDPDAALAKLTRKHVPLLYWTGASWAAAFAVDKTDSELSSDQTLMEKVMRRALQLDDAWEMGSIHDFFITWDAGHAGAGGTIKSAREHFERAKALSAGKRASPFVSLAESVAVAEQNKKEFQQLLNEALAVDVNAAPEQRLANVLSQRRARWLLTRLDELFAE
jgi:predicted anti-sigma-YlaC factor YlaD